MGADFQIIGAHRRLPDHRGRLRDNRGRHRPRAHRAGVRRGRLQRRRSRRRAVRPAGPHSSSTPSSPTAPTTNACAVTKGVPTRGASSRTPALTEELIADLEARGLLLSVQEYEHSYPHCWRCGTPLIYYAKPSWYIATSKVRERMLAANETVALASTAHQARPLRRLALQQRRLGALARALLGHAAAGVALRRRAPPRDRLVRGAGGALGQALADHHRPYVDEIEFMPEAAAP